MRRRCWHPVVVIAALLAALLGFHDGEHGTTYGPPFQIGPSGGDEYNHVDASEDGTVTVARAYPLLGSVAGCGNGAGYAKFQVVHPVDAAVTQVTVDFTEAAVDPYTFATAAVRTPGYDWLGHTAQRGAIAGDGQLVVPVAWPDDPGDAPDTLTIEFGLELSSACPSVDAGRLRFTQVTVQ